MRGKYVAGDIGVMTILQVCAYAAPYEGNFITSLKALAEKAEKLGHKTIYVFPETAKEKEWCQALMQKTDVYFLPLGKARIKPATYTKLRKIYKAHPDLGIIHCHFELYDIPVVVTAKKNVRVFWHLHDAIGNMRGGHNRLMHKIQYGWLHKKAVLLSVSEKHKDYAVKLGFPSTQAYYIPNGLNTDSIKKVDTAYGDRVNDFLMFGWHHKIKGVDLCVQAQQNLGNKYKVSIVGKNDTADLIREEFGKVENISIIEPVTNVNELYNETKCFLHISRAEGLSYALLEAIYAGLPILCSNIKENMFADIFPTVTMVESENVQSIAEGMQRAMDKGAPTIEEIAEARGIIDERYSIACWTNTIIKSYGID